MLTICSAGVCSSTMRSRLAFSDRHSLSHLTFVQMLKKEAKSPVPVYGLVDPPQETRVMLILNQPIFVPSPKWSCYVSHLDHWLRWSQRSCRLRGLLHILPISFSLHVQRQDKLEEKKVLNRKLRSHLKLSFLLQPILVGNYDNPSEVPTGAIKRPK